MHAPIKPPLPHPSIASYVTRYVRLRRRHALVRAAGFAAVFVLAWGLGCCMLDRAAGLLPVVRLVLLLAAGAGALLILFRPLAQWLSRDVNWSAASAEIERHDGALAQRLQTVTSATLEPPPYRASPDMVDALSREVANELSGRPPAQLLRRRPVLLPWSIAGLLVTTAVALAAMPAVALPRLAQRFLFPLRPIPPATTTHLMLQPSATSVVEGESFRVTVVAERLAHDGVTLAHTRPGDAWTSVPMMRQPSGAFEAVIGPVTADVQFYARGGDARTPTGTARVLRRPVVNAMRVRYTYPPHTNRAPLTIADAAGLIEAPLGTRADVTVVANVPLSSAAIDVGGESVQLSPTDDPRARRGSIAVSKDQPGTVALVSADGVAGAGASSFAVRAVPDRPPFVQVLQPPGELRLHPRDILSLPFQALDDYGITSLTTNVQITASGVDASGEPINLARGKPATQPSTWGGGDAARAVDGNTDGNFLAGSVTHTDLPAAWWQIDLGNVAPVSVIEVWNRADAVPERLGDFFLFVSDGPFLSDDPAAISAQAGVATHRIPGVCGRPTRIEVFRTARFVRVQLAKAEYLSLAEVRVLQAKPAAAGELASRSFNTNITVTGDARQQEAEASLDLAKIKVGVGDVISVSVSATDTGKQVTTAPPVRVVVSPRSIDQRAYDRIGELKRASQAAGALVAQLDAAAGSFEPARARGVGHIDAYLAALAAASRELAGVADSTSALHSALLRCVIRSDSPDQSVALAAMLDDVQQTSASASAISSRFAFDSTPSEADRAALAATAATAKRVAAHVAAILRGEQAAAIVADLDNLRASEQGTPSAKEAADRARERARRVREDIVAAAKEVGLDPDAVDLQSRLKALTAARTEAIKAYGVPDFVPAAQEYAAALAARSFVRPPLVPRLSAAAQAEAIRPDANLIRARDLQLAASAALRIREAPAAVRDEFTQLFPASIAAVQREYTSVQAAAVVPPATIAPATTTVSATTTTVPATAPQASSAPASQPAEEVQTAATEARRRLSLWAKGESDELTRVADAAARAQALALQANADLAARDYASAEAADERIARELQLAERTFPRAAQRFEQARQDVRRATDRARSIDRLTERQQALSGRSRQESPADVATEQRKFADTLAAAEEFEDWEDEPASTSVREDTRLPAIAAIRSAQERLAAMPQQLRDVEPAVADRASAANRLRRAQAEQLAAPEESKAAVARAVRGAERQLGEADQRLAETLRPLADFAALEMARSLSPHGPETDGAARAVRDRLHPALSSLQRIAGAGSDEVANAVVNVRGAIDAVQTELKGSQALLLERDPLFAARVYAQAAASSLANQPAGAGDALAQQRDVTTALARAWDASIHEAAAARLAGLPTMRSLFAPPPDAGSPPAPPGPAQGVAMKFPMFFDWGRLPWRMGSSPNAAPRASDPPAYQDALQAYFEALGATQPPPSPTTKPSP